MAPSGKKNEYWSVWLLLLGFCGTAVVVLVLCLAASARLPEQVGRRLTDGEAAGITARNSPLASYVYLSPNADFPRGDGVRKITVHHMAGDLSLEGLGLAFAQRDRQASSNYAIDSQGQVALYVEEANRAWTSSDKTNDDQAVTIEVANDEIGGSWHVSDAAFETLVELCADICRRNGIQELRYTGDAEGNLTTHKMFNDGTECPGPYLEGRMEELAGAVNRRLSGGE